jgi:hypothetical protein
MRTMTVLMLMMVLAAPYAAAADPTAECRLADCLPAIESFPPEPCAGQTIPREIRRRVRQVQDAIQREANSDDPPVARPARATLKWLRRATERTKVAVAEGKLTGTCAEVLQGQLRNARACVACPALRETPAGRQMAVAS